MRVPVEKRLVPGLVAIWPGSSAGVSAGVLLDLPLKKLIII